MKCFRVSTLRPSATSASYLTDFSRPRRRARDGAIHIPGHLAAAYLSRSGTLHSPFGLGWLVLGALLPDLVDKSLLAAGVYPWGRTVGHSVLFAAVLALAGQVQLRFSRRAWLAAVAAGVALHLVTDVVDDAVEALQWSGVAFTAWAGWPVLNPDLLAVRISPVGGWLAFSPSLLELATVALAATLLLRRARAG